MTVIAFDEVQHPFEVRIPLVIIGAGACGLVAALAAKELGIELVVLERDNTPRGSTFMSSGFIPAANTRFQTAAGVVDSSALMVDDIQHKNHNEADPSIVQVLADQSARVIEWLADQHKIPFELVQGFLYPGHSQMRMHSTPRRTGQELMSTLLNAAAEAGVDILTNAHVTALYVDAQSCIQGVSYQQPDGQVETIGCDALLLACNGYGGNKALVDKYLPQMNKALYYGHEGNQGDAVIWGEQLGASLMDLTAFQGHGSLADPPQTLISWAVMMQGGVQVNTDTERFADENQGYSEAAAKVLAQPTGYVFNIYDERIHQTLLAFEDYQNALTTKSVKSFASRAELATGLGLDDTKLEQMFALMTQSSEAAEPDALGRTFVPEQQLVAPFYAIKVTGALFHTQGGLEIDTAGRVLSATGDVMPNLFAAGGAARGVSGSNDTGYLSGNGLLHAVVLGAIAGESAAKKVLS